MKRVVTLILMFLSFMSFTAYGGVETQDNTSQLMEYVSPEDIQVVVISDIDQEYVAYMIVPCSLIFSECEVTQETIANNASKPLMKQKSFIWFSNIGYVTANGSYTDTNAKILDEIYIPVEIVYLC